MRIKIILDGNEYISPKTEENHEELSNRFYDKMGELCSFHMRLEDGSFLLMGKKAVQRAVLIFCP